MKRFLFLGNSHLMALIDAVKRHQGAGDVRDEGDLDWHATGFRCYDFVLGEPGSPEHATLHFILLCGAEPPLFVADEHGKIGVSPDFLQRINQGLARLGGQVDKVVSCFHGNDHSIFSMVEHPAPFDVFLGPDDEPVPPALRGGPRQVVPAEVVRRELADRSRLTVRYCQFLRHAFPRHEVVHVMPPPPIADERQLRKNPEIFARHFALFGVAPAPLRRKVYQLYGQMLGDELHDSGVQVMLPPPRAQVDGYLHESMWMEATHANHLYGQQVLQQLGAM